MALHIFEDDAKTSVDIVNIGLNFKHIQQDSDNAQSPSWHELLLKVKN